MERERVKMIKRLKGDIVGIKKVGGGGLVEGQGRSLVDYMVIVYRHFL